MEKVAKCSDCDKEGLPSEYHRVSREGNEITIRCANCSKVVMKLAIKEECLILDEDK